MTFDEVPLGTATPSIVVPVIDYEPPIRAVARRRPAPATGKVRRLRGLPTTSRPDPPRPVALPPALQAAASFADAALRRVLEVVDQRRPPAHLYPLFAASLVESVSRHPGAAHHVGAATLQRVRVQVAGPDDPPAAVEAFGTYRRGRRIHALACRIERLAATSGSGWQVVALHIG
ncbi:MAG: Rv3235 family protein [Mycobacterium sp.]